MKTGKRIFLKRLLPDSNVVSQFEDIPASNVADVMERSSAMHPRIRLMSSIKNKTSVAGPALTVKTRAGDNLAIHQALGMLTPGDILVVSNEEDDSRSLAGEIMLTFAVRHGAAAVIFDGPVRDVDAIREMPIPIYATGSTPGGPYKLGPGEVNVPISCGGQYVAPGDILVCDADGITVVPREDAEDILKEAQSYKLADTEKLEKAKADKSDKSWVMKSLLEKGYTIIDDYYKV